MGLIPEVGNACRKIEPRVPSVCKEELLPESCLEGVFLSVLCWAWSPGMCLSSPIVPDVECTPGQFSLVSQAAMTVTCVLLQYP